MSLVYAKPIYCCGCQTHVKATLTTGKEIYPHRKDLYKLPFWQCPHCGNYVGTHHKTKSRLRPLGTIPTPDLRKLRNQVHDMLDPLWRDGAIKRQKLYRRMSKELGYEFHTSSINSADEAHKIMGIINQLYIELLETNDDGDC